MSTDEDVAKLKKALEAERAQHKEAKALLVTAQQRITALEAEGHVDPNSSAAKLQEHIEATVTARVALASVDHQKQIADLTGKLAGANEATAKLKGTLDSMTISNAVKEACTAAQFKPDALADMMTFAAVELSLDKDGNLVTKDGASVADWLDAQKETRPWAWPVARGSGARGDGDRNVAPITDNPFLPGPGFSLTKQSRIARESPALAERLQAQARAGRPPTSRDIKATTVAT